MKQSLSCFPRICWSVYFGNLTRDLYDFVRVLKLKHLLNRVILDVYSFFSIAKINFRSYEYVFCTVFLAVYFHWSIRRVFTRRKSLNFLIAWNSSKPLVNVSRFIQLSHNQIILRNRNHFLLFKIECDKLSWFLIATVCWALFFYYVVIISVSVTS